MACVYIVSGLVEQILKELSKLANMNYLISGFIVHTSVLTKVTDDKSYGP
jgi:hypothetical protein